MISTGDDIRFLDSGSCKPMPYWIESGINTTTTTIWIKMPVLPSSAFRTIKMYYGNSSAPAVSNGDSTFVFFDDFPGSSLNTTKWSSFGSNSSYSITNSKINISAGNSSAVGARIFVTNQAFASPIIVEGDITSISGYYTHLGTLDSGTWTGYTLFYGGPSAGSNAGMHTGLSYSHLGAFATNFITTNTSPGTLTGMWQSVWPSTSLITGFWPGGSFSASVSGLTLSSRVQVTFGLDWNSTGAASFDWVRARKYAAKDATAIIGASMRNGYQSDVTFQKALGGSSDEIGCSVISLPDKGFIIGGTTTSFGAGGTDIFLIRTDSLGKKIWAKTFGGSSAEGATNYVFSAGVDFIMTPDSNIVVCSTTASYGAGGNDVYFFKIDLNGNVKWTKTYGGTSNDYGFSVINDPKGGFLLAGETFSYGAGSGDVFVIKTDTSGKVLWAKAYGGSSNEEAAWKIRNSRDGNFLICGYSYSSSSTYYDEMLMKIDDNGKLLFNKVYGTSNYDAATAILDLPDSSIYTAGFTYNIFNSANTVALLSKYDKSGNLAWSYIYDKAQHSSFFGTTYDSVSKVLNSLIWISKLNRFGILRTDLAGKYVFLKNYGPATGSGAYTGGIGRDILQLPSGGFALAYSTNDFGAGGWDYFFAKVDKNGSNSDSCNITPYSLTPFDFTSYISNYTYTFSTTSVNPSVNTGMKSSNANVKDTLACDPLVTAFNWQIPCSGQPTQFLDSSYYKPTSWQWNFGDPTSSSNTSDLQNPTHTYAKAGKYTVKLISGNGNDADSISKIITVKPSPTQIKTSTTTFCIGDSLNFSASGTGGKSFSWSQGSLLNDSTDSTVWAYPYQNTTFVATVTNSNGCSNNDTFIVKIDTSSKCSKATTIGGVINQYASVSAYDSCQNFLVVDSSSFFKKGSKALLIESQGASINGTQTSKFGLITNYANSGNFEYVTVDSISGSTIYLKNVPLRSYDTKGGLQLVTVPQYNGTVMINKTLTAQPWNGKKGGVLIFEASGTVIVAANINTSGKGFRGGGLVNSGHVCEFDSSWYVSSTSTDVGGKKGEGIATTISGKDAAKAAQANGGGGGGEHNGGGAGGGNAGKGGVGGNTWNNSSCHQPNTAQGGYALTNSKTIDKMYFGGGGGAGHENNSGGTAGSNGGGITIISANRIIGGGYQISSDGLTNPNASIADGSGGGGAGGTIALLVGDFKGHSVFSAKGGNGNNNNPGDNGFYGDVSLGPGGGGGGGLIWYSSSLPSYLTTNVSPGLSGIIVDKSSSNYLSNYGADSGRSGLVLSKLPAIPESAIATPFSKIITTSQSICYGDSIKLSASVNGLKSFTWTPSGTVKNPTSANTYAFPTTNTQYKLTAITNGGCTLHDSVFISVFPAKPVTPVIVNSTVTDNADIQLTISLSSLVRVTSVTTYVSVDGGSFTKVAASAPAKNITLTASSLATTKHQFTYVVIATDSCGNNSDSSVKHTPVLLQGTAGQLRNAIKWKNYIGYKVDSIVIQRLVKGSSSWITIARPKPTTTSYTDSSYMKCGVPLFYRIESYGTGQTSLSDTISLTPFDTVSSPTVVISNASVKSKNDISFGIAGVPYVVKKNTHKYLIYERKNSDPFVLIDSLIPKDNKTFGVVYNYNVNTIKDTFSFEVFAVDSCGNASKKSDILRTVHLDGSALDDSIKLNWSPYLGAYVYNYYLQTWSRTQGWENIYYIPRTSTTIKLPANCNDTFNYRISVIFVSGTGNNNTYSDSVQIIPFDTIPPSRDSILSASVVDGSHINVTFNPVPDKDAYGYIIYRSKNHGAFIDIDTVKNPASSPIHFIDNVNTLTDTFSYKIYALDNCGNVSLSAQTHRAIQLNGKALDDSSLLSWSPYEGFNINNYTIQTRKKNTNWVDTYTGISSSTTTYIAPGSCNDSFYYRIKAIENGGTNAIVYSDSVMVMPYDTISPSRDSIISASVTDGSHISLIFNKVTAPDVIGYNVYRSKNNGVFAKVGTISRPKNSPITFTDNINTLTDTFSYEVYAFDSCGNTSKTTQMHRAIQLNGKALDDSSYLSWSPYEGFNIKNYTVQTRTKKTSWTDTYTSILPSTTTFIAPGSCNDTFYYRIAAIENGGTNATVYSDSIAIVPFDTIRPAKPAITYVTALSSKSIQVNWVKTTANDVKNYNVYRNGVKIASLGNLTTYTDTGLNTSNSYCYAVEAQDSCAGNLSGPSPPHCSVALNTEVKGCEKSIYLSWNKYSGWATVKKYEIYRTVNGGTESLLTSLTASATTFKDSLLDYHSKYCYRILAYDNSSANVSWSNQSCNQTFFVDTPQIITVTKTVTSTTNGTVVIRWKSINTPHLAYNTLYYSADGTNYNLLKDNIAPTIDSFAHTGLNTQSADQHYYLVSVDSCGTKSDSSVFHKNMTLTVSVGELLHILNWTHYQGFKVKKYYIQKLINGNFKTIDSVADNDTASRYFPAPCNSVERYRIAAEGYAPGELSWSDTMGRQAIDTVPSDAPQFKNATVVNGTTTRIDFIGSDSLDTYDFVIQRATDGNWATAGHILFTTPGKALSYLDKAVNTINHQLCYTIIARDSCLNATPSDTFCVIRLKGDSQNLGDSLNWTSFRGYGLKDYAVLRYNGTPTWDTLAKVNNDIFHYTDKPLPCDVSHIYKIEGFQNGGTFVTMSDSITLTPFDTIKPPGPVIKLATVLDDSHIQLSWHKSISKVKLYELSIKTGKGNWKVADTVKVDTSFIFNGLNTPDSVYDFRIVAIDSCAANRSQPSLYHSPVQLGGQDQNLSNLLTWKKYEGWNSVSKYYIYQLNKVTSIWTKIDSVSGTTLNYLHKPLPCDVMQAYQVVALDNTGQYLSYSDTVQLTPYDTIKPPEVVIKYATVLNANQVELFWHKSIPKVKIYELSIKTGKGNWKVADTVKVDTSFIFNGLNTPDSIYDFRIVAIDSCAANRSQPSLYHSPVQLGGKDQNLSNLLTWKKYEGWTSVSKYYIYQLNKNTGIYVKIDSVSGTTLSYLHKPLPCDVMQAYQVVALDNTGQYLSYSDTVQLTPYDTIKPPEVVIKYATVLNDNQVELFWHKSIPKVKIYELSIKTGKGNWKIADTVRIDTSFIFNGLNTPDSVYDFRIVAIDSCAANRSQPSLYHSPVQLGGQDQNLSNLLTWKKYEGWNSVSKYYIYQLNKTTGIYVKIDSVSGTTLSYLHKPLPCDVLQAYKIAALDNTGQYLSYSDTVQLTPYDTIKPPAPVIKYATVLDRSHIQLFWHKSIPKVKLYELSIKRANGNWQVANTVKVDTSFIFSGLTTYDSVYAFRIVAIDSCAANRSTSSAFHSPVKISGTALDDTVRLNWKPYEGFASVKEYYIYQLISSRWKVLDSVPGNIITYTSKTLPCNVPQAYRIKALDNTGAYLSQSDTVSVTPFDTIKPKPPVLNYATVLPSQSVKITWQWDPKSDVKFFEIWRSKNKGIPVLIDTVIYDSSYTDTSARPHDNRYAYYIIAIDSCNKANRSRPSNSDTLMFLKIRSVFCTPEVGLQWTAYTGPDVSSYHIFRSKDGKTFTGIGTVSPQQHAFNDNSVSLGLQYYYTILAITAAGDSSFSDTLGIVPSVVPLADSAQLVYATVVKSDEKKGAIMVKWRQDSPNDTNARGYFIYAMNPVNGQYTLVENRTNLGDTTYIDTALNTIEYAYKYYIVIYNVCDLGINSRIHRPILLSVKNNDLNAQLTWKNYLGVPVKSYVVYKSEDGGLPYLLKTTGTDSVLADSNIYCGHKYTYQVQALLANNEITFSDSITIKVYDTVRPKTRPIKSVSVTRTGSLTGNISVSWNPAKDVNLKGYNIFRSNDGFSWFLIKEVYGDTTMVDSGLNTYGQSYYYKIQPFDSCGNLGNYSLVHESIRLKVQAQNSYNQLNWNGYQGWRVEKYIIYRDGKIFGSTAKDSFHFNDTLVYCGIEYQYKVVGIDSLDSTIISFSNTDSARAFDHVAPAKVYIKAVSVLKPNRAVTISWAPSTSWDVMNYDLYRKFSIDGSMHLVGITTDTIFADSSTEITQPDCYYVFANDHCSNRSEGSNPGCIMILSAKASAGSATGQSSNDLKWNGYQTWFDGVQSYNVYKKDDNQGWRLIGTTTSGNVHEYSDANLSDSTIDFCYQVEAVENPGKYNQLTRSTVECVHQDATMFIPNSFSPYNQDGINDKFGPVGLYVKNYTMKIYDRWGEEIYNTNSGQPWDGTFHGQFVQQGVYIYYIAVQDYNGKITRFRGNISMYE